VLENRVDADDNAHDQGRVKNPAPFFIAKGAQEQKKEREVQPRPHPAHALKISKQAVIAGRGEKRGQERRRHKRHERPENRFVPEIEVIAAEA